MMFDSTPGDFKEPKPALPGEINGYINWVLELDNEANQTFLQYYKTENGKEANLFSMQGWENALLIIEYLQQRKDARNTETAIGQLIGKKIYTPRGAIHVNEQKYILGPAYLAQATGNLQITIEETINDTSAVWQKMQAQIPDEPFSSWRNTYLCI